MPLHPVEHPWVLRLSRAMRPEAPRQPIADGPPRSARRLAVFGVGVDWVQLTWSALGPGLAQFRCGDAHVEILTDGGPGSCFLDGLAPDTHHEIVIDCPGLDRRTARRARTLARPPGDLLLRIATVSDVHVGSLSTGYLHTIVEAPRPEVPHPLRCLSAALDEIRMWGADHLVVKGDLVDRSNHENWDEIRPLLKRMEIPIEVIPGNHERSKVGDVDPAQALDSMGLSLVEGVQIVDHAGVRIVMADTTRFGTDKGTIEPVAAELLTAAAVDAPVFLGLHHQPMRFRFPTYLPPGLPGPEVRSFLRSLGAVNERVIVSSGHTHRHRRHRVGGVTATEVGSTKDFPGTWAGYEMYEGGVVQTVRRIAEPSCIRWTDLTRRAAGGVWGHWSPGRLRSRCFSLRW